MQWCIRLNTVGAQLLRELLCLTMVLTVLGLRLWQKKYWSAWICPTNHMLPLDHQPNPRLFLLYILSGGPIWTDFQAFQRGFSVMT